MPVTPVRAKAPGTSRALGLLLLGEGLGLQPLHIRDEGALGDDAGTAEAVHAEGGPPHHHAAAELAHAPGPLFRGATEAWSAVIEEFWKPMLAASRPEARERLLSQMRATSQAGARAGLGALLTFDPVAALRRYPGPRLSVITAFNEEPAPTRASSPSCRSGRWKAPATGCSSMRRTW